MNSSASHYDTLLAGHYTWMSGGPEMNYEKNELFFRDAGIRGEPGSRALDLGCGSGFQSIALARMGFNVTAIDQSAGLLKELDAEKGDLPVRTVHDDLLNFSGHCAGDIKLMVCMGDTLTHLDSKQAVAQLFKMCSDRLSPGGRLVITYRDMASELSGLDRFIPVRSSSRKVFTCFLEYGDNRVKVHDLVYERHQDRWQFKKSCYYKLRLPRDWVTRELGACGFEVSVSTAWNGMTAVLATRPPLTATLHKIL